MPSPGVRSPSSSPKCLCLFLDCRVSDGDRGYAAFRQVVHLQCARLLALSKCRDRRDSALSVVLYLITHTCVERVPLSLDHAAGEEGNVFSSMAWSLAKVAAAPPDYGSPYGGTSCFANSMTTVVPHLQHALGDTQQWNSVLFCSSYVTHTDLTQGLSVLRLAEASQVSLSQLRCVIVDWDAVRVTKGELRRGVWVYRCSHSALQLQCALQDACGFFLLSIEQPSLLLRLAFGQHVIAASATLRYYGASFLPCSTGGGSLHECGEPTVRQHVEGMPCGNTRKTFSDSLSAPVAPKEADKGVPTLRLVAVLDANQLDESLLFGDTWVLSWKACEGLSPCSTAISSSSSSASDVAVWIAFFKAFTDEALLWSGDAVGLHAGCPATVASQTHHHFVGYFMADMTMRLREVVPCELRFVPLPTDVLSPCISRQQQALEEELGALRQDLISSCSSSSFSLDSLLTGWPSAD